MACLVCGEREEVGSLCRAHAQQVVPCDGLIPEHIRSNVAEVDADAWLVDGFGCAHAVSERTKIGRGSDASIEILAGSVSREQAEFRKNDDETWTLRDVGSHNGTFVDGAKFQRGALPRRAVVKFGQVAMWFLADVVEEPTRQAPMATQTAGAGLVRYLMDARAGLELCLVAGNDGTVGGTLLSRVNATDEWVNTELPPLEFQLLRALCMRAHAESSAPSAARGCVATKQLARDLPFQSKYANEENVRQVVRRLRTQLAELGSEKILAVVPGRGYYLACLVTTGADAR